jgi:hypothetical protein
MREKPILFNTEMVRAILDGRKTMTRRIVKNEKIFQAAAKIGEISSALIDKRELEKHDLSYILQFCPFGTVGDGLWVRETWSEYEDNYFYRASIDLLEDKELDQMKYGFNKWKPSLFMPKSACRLKLRITNIRVERLNDISRGDAMQEGCPFQNLAKVNNPISWFMNLWESINGKGSWDKNPWVWVVEFEKLKK